MANLQTTYMGLSLKNPIVIGSCGLTNSISNLKELETKGAGAVVIKSMFEEQIKIETEDYIKNEKGGMATYTQTKGSFIDRRIHDYDEAYAYIYEYAKSNTLDKYLEFLKEAKQTINIPIIASINCVSNYNWQSFAQRIQATGIDALELNIYVLPSDFRRSPEDNEYVYLNVIKEIKRYITIPIAIKLGYYFSSLASSVKEISESGINAVVMFNRPYNPDIDIEKIALHTGHIYSSENEYGRTLRWVSILSGHLGCDIAAATGNHSHETIIKQILAGANVAQVTSALYIHKFDIIPQMIQGITDWMNRHNFETIDAFRGKLSSKNLVNPAAMERVQFMKLYSGIE